MIHIMVIKQKRHPGKPAPGRIICIIYWNAPAASDWRQAKLAAFRLIEMAHTKVKAAQTLICLACFTLA